MKEKLTVFAALVEKETLERLRRQFGSSPYPFEKDAATSVKPGKKYTKVDVGGSGKYMVDAEGNIYGIKAYGVIHKGHRFGSLDTIHDWYWGGYHPIKKVNS